MAIREFSPIYQWGFSLRTPKFLVPLLNNNVFIFGKEAMQSSESFPFVSSNEADSEPLMIIKKKKLSKLNDLASPQSSLSPSPSTPSNTNTNTTNETIITTTISTSPCIEALENPSQKGVISRSSSSTSLSSSVASSIKDKSDEEILYLIQQGTISAYSLESLLSPDFERAVILRRQLLLSSSQSSPQSEPLSLEPIQFNLPYSNYDYSTIFGRNCENVIGYVEIPVGVAGPLLLNGKQINLPLATTEGCLVASTARGCKAISMSGGATAVIIDDGMTRAPAIRFPDVKRANKFKKWIAVNFDILKERFESTSRYAKLKSIKVTIAGRVAYVRFKATTGDAMGMNMLTKGVDICLEHLSSEFPEMEIIAISGNFCTDKKPAAVNWIEGRGKSLVCECVLKKSIVEQVLKTSVDKMIETNIAKNLIGSAVAGAFSGGGMNAHAANIVSAMFLATGQDIAQNVDSSSCLTVMEKYGDQGDLYVAVTMPSVEVGAVGGGTHLGGQRACLDMLVGRVEQGKKARWLAKAVCGGVLAGEISLLAALTAGHLTRSHMQLNRAK